MFHRNAAVAPPTAGGVESEYARRIALATPADTARGLFFNSVLSAVKGFGGEAALSQCRSLLDNPRFERRFVDFSSYPITEFLQLAMAASQVLSDQLGSQERTQRRLGMQSTRDFFNSMAGKTLLLLSGKSPQRILNNIPSGYRSAVSYGERTVTFQGDNAAHISFKRDFMLPLFTEGVMLAVLEAVEARDIQVHSRSLGVLDSEYEVSWQ